MSLEVLHDCTYRKQTAAAAEVVHGEHGLGLVLSNLNPYCKALHNWFEPRKTLIPSCRKVLHEPQTGLRQGKRVHSQPRGCNLGQRTVSHLAARCIVSLQPLQSHCSNSGPMHVHNSQSLAVDMYEKLAEDNAWQQLIVAMSWQHA